MRKADLLTTVETTEQALEASELFFQYYRENANYLERTYDFVERLGIEKVRKETVYAPEPVRQGLLDRFAQVEGARRRRVARRARRRRHPTQFIPIQRAGEGAGMNERRWIRVTACENIPLREGRAVTLGGREIAIFNLGDRVPGDRQPVPAQGRAALRRHRRRRLGRVSAARLEGRASTPAPSSGPPAHDKCVATYPTRIDDGIVVIGLPAARESATRAASRRTRT